MRHGDLTEQGSTARFEVLKELVAEMVDARKDDRKAAATRAIAALNCIMVEWDELDADVARLIEQTSDAELANERW